MADIVSTLPNGWMSIEYEMGVEPFIWRDSISGPMEVIQAMTQADIDAEKQARYQAWLAIVTPQSDEGV